MDAYRTEEEQLEELRRWWNENGKAIMLGIFLAVAIVFGWQGWQKHTHKSAAEASETYSQFVNAIIVASSSMKEEEMATAKHLYQTILDQHGKTSYREFAGLLMAAHHVQHDQLQLAAETLNAVLDASRSEEVLTIARLRLARIKLAQGENDVAMTLLEDPVPESWESTRQEIRGDIHLARGEKSEAVMAYRGAIKAQEALAISPDPVLLMKASSLGVKPSGDNE